MSADNGIYIASFPDGYRVIHAQAIEDIDYYPPMSDKRKEVLLNYFGDSPLFDTEKEALKYANELYKEIMSDDIPILEYGISFLGEYEAFN